MSDGKKSSVSVIHNIRLNNVVVKRYVPMTAEGCDNLRSLRRYFTEEFRKEKGVDVELQYPTVIDMSLSKLCNMLEISDDPTSGSKA